MSVWIELFIRERKGARYEQTDELGMGNGDLGWG